MSELPHYFGSVHDGSENRPGPIETLVEGWTRADPRALHNLAPEMLARKIDEAIAETAAAIRQLPSVDTEGGMLARLNLRSLDRVPIITTLGGVRDLDELVGLCDVLAPFGVTDLADASWNFRNLAIPYKPGDEHYLDPNE